MLHYLSRRLKKKTASATTTETTISPLGIPEILDLILSYLDDYTIRRSVNRVCRQWYLLAQPYLAREVIWYERWRLPKQEKALCKLPGASKLHVSFHSITQSAFKTVRNALLLLEDEYRKQRDDGLQISTLDPNSNSGDNMSLRIFTSAPGAYDITPLREMEMFFWFYHSDSIEWFPFPSTLYSLTIRFSHAHYTTIDLQGILEKCPALERLRIELHGPPVILSSFGCRLTSTIEDSSRRQPLSLRSLILCGVGFAQEELESLLLHTPRLRDLQLKAMLWSDDFDKYDWPRLFRFLKARNITLDKSHFSMLGSRMSAEETEILLTDIHHRSSQKRSLWALDITPQLLQTVFSQPGTLTTLEILWKPASKEYPRTCCDRSLNNTYALVHKQICESKYLVHLTTLKTIVRLQDIDLFHRAGYTDLDTRHDATITEHVQSSTLASQLPPVIWRCRGLRTLHIDLHTPQVTQEQPVYSRIVFGYISRVCPFLEDLQVGVQEPPRSSVEPGYYFRYHIGLSLRLQGGLCLLGRLKFLQRLRVFSDVGEGHIDCEDWDVNWIIVSGRKSILSNWRRRQEVKNWREWRKNEDKVETIRAQIRKQRAISGICDSKPNADGVILDQLKNLGLLLDVEEMVKEMEAKMVIPMQALERVSFKHPVLMRPEDELERFFPSRFEKWRF
jgi:hypothetical protein